MKIKRIALMAILWLSLISFAVFAQGELIDILRFKDADIRLVLQAIAQKATREGKKINIIMTPEVQGLVTLDLESIDWETALGVVLKTQGYEYIQYQDVIIVAPYDKIKEMETKGQERQELELPQIMVFKLKYTDVNDAKKAVDPLLSKFGKVSLLEGANQLIIADTQSNLMRLSEIIKGLDKITPQVAIEAKIIETTLGTAEKLGIDWTLQVALQGSARPTTFPFQAGEEYKGTGKKMFPKVQVPTSLGQVDTTSVTGGTGTSSSTTSTEEKIWHSLINAFPDVPTNAFQFGTLDFSQVKVVLEVLNSRSKTKIISNPHITTLNNQQAEILVGTVVPIPNYEYSKDTGTRVVSGYTNLKIGVGLTVTPNINEKDYISLKIKPTIDEITGWTGPNNERPIISTRSAETKVMIKDGQTLVIGGLISEKKIKSRKKIPLLGDIPVLGYLFSKKEDTVDKTELLIFVTPHIITEGMSPPEEIAELEEGLGKDKKESTVIKKK